MDHTKELILLAHNGDKQARELLVEENMGLVRSVAGKFAAMGQEYDDMAQLGAIGLLKCIDRFDLSQEVKFSTYAVPMIIGEIRRFLRDDGIIKVSRTLKENNYKIKRASSELSSKLGREATIDEISEKTGISPEDIILAREADIETVSIYQTAGEDDGNDNYILDRLSEKDLCCQPDGTPEDTEKTVIVNKIFLNKILSELSDRERKLIMLRYYDEKTQSETAEQLGMTQVQVSRLEKKILLGLRKKAT